MNYKIFGLRRSGTHMLLIPILNNYEDHEVYFFNNIYDHVNLLGNTKGNSRYYTDMDKFWFGEYSNKLAKKIQYNNFNSINKRCLIELYEDKPLDIYNVIGTFRTETIINNIPILILRDPVNMVSSRLEHLKRYNDSVMGITSDILYLWISYAKEYLGYTNILGNNKICINYNTFVMDDDYREEIYKKLKITSYDGSIPILPFNKGSSFSGTKLEGGISYMKRYKLYEEDEILLKVKNDGEIMSYVREIFGDIY